MDPDTRRLLAAVRSAGVHDHRDLHHGQTGNPFFPWWHEARWCCDLCLLVMRLEAPSEWDFAYDFRQAVPFGIDRRYRGDSEAVWWKTAYLKAVRLVSDPEERREMREAVAWALQRGADEKRQFEAQQMLEVSGDAALADR